MAIDSAFSTSSAPFSVYRLSSFEMAKIVFDTMFFSEAVEILNALDVGAYAAALEYASGHEAVTVGKPAQAFFLAAMADMRLERGIMVGDDLEADVGGAMAAGLPGVLVRTGKYRQDALKARVTPTAIVDSIKDVPGLLPRIFPPGA